MKFLKHIIAFITIVVVVNAEAQTTNAKMNAFVNNLLSKMTLDEKLGQLNLPGAGDITTGQASNSDIGLKIRE